MLCDRLPYRSRRQARQPGRPRKTERPQRSTRVTPSIILSPDSCPSTQIRLGVRARTRSSALPEEQREMA